MRRRSVWLLACLLACRSGANGTDAIAPVATDPAPPASTIADASLPPRRAAWDHGSPAERLDALSMTSRSFARRDVYSWTTHAQVEAIRTSGKLYVARGNDGPKSPFVWRIEALARRKDTTGALATILATDTRFDRRRYAWTAAYATVLGLLDKRYGDELVHVRLRPDAVFVSIAPPAGTTSADEASEMTASDMDGKPIALDVLVADPSRIGAIYHVRKGLDVPAPFREIVLVNEDAIASYGIGTPRIVAELGAEKQLLRELAAMPEVSKEGRAPRRPRERAKRFDAPLPTSASIVDRWDGSLAFPISRYELDGPRLRDIGAALEGARITAPPIEYPSPGATDD